jgi:hypothetical protein
VAVVEWWKWGGQSARLASAAQDWASPTPVPTDGHGHFNAAFSDRYSLEHTYQIATWRYDRVTLDDTVCTVAESQNYKSDHVKDRCNVLLRPLRPVLQYTPKAEMQAEGCSSCYVPQSPSLWDGSQLLGHIVLRLGRISTRLYLVWSGIVYSAGRTVTRRRPPSGS